MLHIHYVHVYTAGMQGVPNPCPRVVHPIWLTRMLNEASTGMKQAKISSMFAAITSSSSSISKNKGIGLIGTKLVSTALPPTGTGSGSTTSILKAGQSPTRAHYSPSRLQSPAMNRKRSLLGDLPSDSPGTGTGLSFPILGSDVGVVAGGDMEDLFGKDGRGTGGKAIAHFKPSSSASGAERRSVSFDLSTDLANTTTVTDIPPSTSTSFIIHSHTQAHTQTQTQVQAASPAITTLQSEDDFNHWLKSRTNTWRTLRSDRKQELKRWANYRNTSSFSTSSMNPLLDQILIKKPLGIADYVRNASLAITHGIWQIIELQEMDTPGEYTAWVMIFGQTPSSTSSSTIQKIKIIVPRELYINCLSKQAEENALASYGTKVVRKLPHGHTSHALYEVELPEHK